MAIFKGIPWPQTSRNVDENWFSGYPRVSPLQTCPLYDNHMQFGANHSQVSTLTHWQLLLPVGLQFAMLWFKHIFYAKCSTVRVSGQYLSLVCIVNWFSNNNNSIYIRIIRINSIYIYIYVYTTTPMLIIVDLPLRLILNWKKTEINLRLITISYGQSCV